MYDFFAPLINYFRQQVGLKADSASASGSVHAKLAFIDALIDTLTAAVSANVPYFKSATPKAAAVETDTDGSWVTMHSVSGAGYITGIHGHIEGGNVLRKLCIEITVDGTVLFAGDSGNTGSAIANVESTGYYDGSSYYVGRGSGLSLMHRFDTSFVIKAYQAGSTTGNYMGTMVTYLLD